MDVHGSADLESRPSRRPAGLDLWELDPTRLEFSSCNGAFFFERGSGRVGGMLQWQLQIVQGRVIRTLTQTRCSFPGFANYLLDAKLLTGWVDIEPSGGT